MSSLTHLNSHKSIWLGALKALTTPGWRWLTTVPALLNMAVFGTLSYFAWQWLQGAIVGIAEHTTITLHNWSGGLLPSSWIESGLDLFLSAAWLLFLLLAGTLYAFSFTLLAQLVGAPFYALLAERIVARESRSEVAQNSQWLKFIAATVWRELGKIAYLLPRTVAVLLLSLLLGLVPVVGAGAPLLLLLWMSWAAALQYLDYGADADRTSFATLRMRAREQRLTTLLFGAVALLCAGLPGINLVLLPLTTAAASLYWCRRYAPTNPA